MENKNIDNINNPNHYKLGCGVERYLKGVEE